MLLTYSHDRFPELIRHNIKIHSIREDKHERWKVGMRIDHWMGNPRNVKRNPYPFLKERNDRLISKQRIEINPELKSVKIEGKSLFEYEIDELAFNDGLENNRMFFLWFNKPFKGWILHWTNKKY